MQKLYISEHLYTWLYIKKQQQQKLNLIAVVTKFPERQQLFCLSSQHTRATVKIKQSRVTTPQPIVFKW